MGDRSSGHRLHVEGEGLAEGAAVWCEPSGHRQAVQRGLQRESGYRYVGRKPLDTGFHVRSPWKDLSLGQDCKVAEGPCSGPWLGQNSVGCPHSHAAGSRAAARICRRAFSLCGVLPLPSTEKT